MDGATEWLMTDVFGDLPIPTLPSWARRAACAGQDPSAFFPEKGGNLAAARALCGSCAVRDACLDFALEQEAGEHWTHRYGLWGGLSPKERAALASQAA